MSSLRSKGDYTVVLLAIARDMLLWLRNQCLQDSDSCLQPLEFKDLISKCDDVLQKARQYLECIASELTIRLLRLSLTHVSKMKQAIVCAMLSAYSIDRSVKTCKLCNTPHSSLRLARIVAERHVREAAATAAARATAEECMAKAQRKKEQLDSLQERWTIGSGSISNGYLQCQ